MVVNHFYYGLQEKLITRIDVTQNNNSKGQ